MIVEEPWISIALKSLGYYSEWVASPEEGIILWENSDSEPEFDYLLQVYQNLTNQINSQG